MEYRPGPHPGLAGTRSFVVRRIGIVVVVRSRLLVLPVVRVLRRTYVAVGPFLQQLAPLLGKKRVISDEKGRYAFPADRLEPGPGSGGLPPAGAHRRHGHALVSAGSEEQGRFRSQARTEPKRDPRPQRTPAP